MACGESNVPDFLLCNLGQKTVRADSRGSGGTESEVMIIIVPFSFFPYLRIMTFTLEHICGFIHVWELSELCRVMIITIVLLTVIIIIIHCHHHHYQSHTHYTPINLYHNTILPFSESASTAQHSFPNMKVYTMDVETGWNTIHILLVNVKQPIYLLPKFKEEHCKCL